MTCRPNVTTFTYERCCHCAIEFKMPEPLADLRKKDGSSFYCPNGHGQHYTKSDKTMAGEAKTREEAAKSDRDNWKEEAQRLLGQLNALKSRKTGLTPADTTRKWWNHLK